MLSDPHIDRRLAILIIDKLWCKPSLDSFFLIYTDCSGTMTGNFAELPLGSLN